MLCRRYNAQEALQMGLINSVVPLSGFDAEVDKWCAEILANCPECIEILKATFDEEVFEMAGNIRRYVSHMYPKFPLGEEVQEAQTAFWEKRKPDFWKLRSEGK